MRHTFLQLPIKLLDDYWGLSTILRKMTTLIVLCNQENGSVKEFAVSALKAIIARERLCTTSLGRTKLTYSYKTVPYDLIWKIPFIESQPVILNERGEHLSYLFLNDKCCKHLLLSL